MADIVNLRRARKARDRVDAQKEAAANRALHGRTKAQRKLDQSEKDRLARTVDGARRDD
jgi:hypothetical protein